MWSADSFLARPHDLIAFSWSAPMRDLAPKIGISDVGLRKLLTAQGIVLPPQGHWNRVHAGKAVAKTPTAPARGPGETGRVQLDARFRGHVAEAGRMPLGGPFVSALVPEDLSELRDRELKAIGRATAPRDLAQPHRGLAALLKREERRRLKFAESGWSWDQRHHDHPLAQRQLRLADGLFKALSRRGHTGEVTEKDNGLGLRVTVGDMGLNLHFELGKDGQHSSASTSSALRALPASTQIKLMLDRSKPASQLSWQDGDSGRLERCLTGIAADLIVAGEEAFRQSLVEATRVEEQWARWREESRQRELEQVKEKRLASLRQSGELLRQAEEIRALVCRVGEAMAGGGDYTPEQLRRWKAWALAHADALDPVLSGQVRSHLLVPELDEPD